MHETSRSNASDPPPNRGWKEERMLKRVSGLTAVLVVLAVAHAGPFYVIF